MDKSNKRTRQVAELIQHEIALIFKRDIADPLFVHMTIREVDLSRDLSNAKVYIGLYDTDKKAEVLCELEQLAPKVRHLLSKKTVLRYVPKLRFIYDDTAEKAARIDTLLKSNQDDDFHNN